MNEKIKSFFIRGLIAVDEKASLLQIVGVVMILIGVIYLLTTILFQGQVITGDKLAAAFFTIMLGVAFTFPKLLEGTDGLSTMRLAMFAIVNVISMLLLKIGWGEGITNLAQIGLDSNWVQVIGFLFGAKAIQSVWENKWGSNKPPEKKVDNDDMPVEDNVEK